MKAPFYEGVNSLWYFILYSTVKCNKGGYP